MQAPNPMHHGNDHHQSISICKKLCKEMSIGLAGKVFFGGRSFPTPASSMAYRELVNPI